MRTLPKAAPLPSLTALRFFAALLVFCFHLSLPGALFTPSGVLAPFATEGFLGVPLFFVLSGFVLGYNHTEVPQRKVFYLARFARVYPLYLFALLLMLPIARTHPMGSNDPPFLLGVAAALLLIQSWIPSMTTFGNPVAWTLSVEAFFYLAFPLLLPFVARQVRNYWIWIGGIWLLFLLPPSLANYQGLSAVLHLPRKTQSVCMHFSLEPLGFLGEFAMGMFGGLAFRRRPKRYSSWAALGMTVLSLAGIYGCKFVGYQAARNSGMALFFLFLIQVLAGWPSRMLSSRTFQLGGEISYSFYLLQDWIIYHIARLPPSTYRIPLAFVCLSVASFLSYKCIEKPARLLLLQRFGGAATPKPTATPETMV